MTHPQYMFDSYIQEFTTQVVSVKDGKYVVLADTIFYPNGGGQPHDEGKLIKDGQEYSVVFVGKFDGKISHEVDKPGLAAGDTVTCVLDWNRRYKLMRVHTASHVLSAVFYKRLGVLITGNQLGVEKSRDDYSLEEFDREKILAAIDETNLELLKNHEVSVSFMDRAEALKIPGIVKLAGALPPSVKELRIVTIGDIDMQADGGTHVKNTSECGQIKLLELKNKGKNNRRMYFDLV